MATVSNQTPEAITFPEVVLTKTDEALFEETKLAVTSGVSLLFQKLAEVAHNREGAVVHEALFLKEKDILVTVTSSDGTKHQITPSLEEQQKRTAQLIAVYNDRYTAFRDHSDILTSLQECETAVATYKAHAITIFKQSEAKRSDTERGPDYEELEKKVELQRKWIWTMEREQKQLDVLRSRFTLRLSDESKAIHSFYRTVTAHLGGKGWIGRAWSRVAAVAKRIEYTPEIANGVAPEEATSPVEEFHDAVTQDTSEKRTTKGKKKPDR